ncbi:toll/interleukin-1 receptor domain-containing protein [Amycolatopsis speibonae]|uniref:Toll/interleukin-1 receptor domain-containing protein n=1 Tax=Amycolatopsis speibonae TaxID=1450224 RepID=A0ABV7NQP5_9PSEU
MTDQDRSAEQQYDVCLSFAGQQRDYAREVAELLEAEGVKVFFDEYKTVDMWGEDTYTHLDEVYNYQSRFCLLFASADFARKVWPNHERRSAQARAIRSAGAYILPIRFDDTKIPGLRETIGYLDARDASPATVVKMLIAKMKRTPVLKTVKGTILVLATENPDLDLDRILEIALTRGRVEVPPELRSRTASRSTAVIPVSERTAAEVLSTVIPALESVAEDRLARLSGTTFRIGVHEGEVPAGNGLRCLDVAATEASVTAAVVDETLAAAPKADCVVVASQRIHDHVLRTGRAGAASYRQVTQPDGSALFLRVPGYAKPPVPGEPKDTAPGKTMNTVFLGQASVHHLGDNNYGGSNG